MKRLFKSSSPMWKPSWRISRLDLVPVLLFILLASGCASLQPDRSIYQEVGIASWYGKDFHGRPTASGEIYNMYGYSAAHKTIPLGSTVRVTHLGNGLQHRGPINDRGPFVGSHHRPVIRGRQAPRNGKRRYCKVRVEVLQVSRTSTARYTLQFGAFTERQNAVTVAQKIQALGYTPSIEEAIAQGQRFYRVRHGTFDSFDQARELADSLNGRGVVCVVIGL